MEALKERQELKEKFGFNVTRADAFFLKAVELLAQQKPGHDLVELGKEAERVAKSWLHVADEIRRIEASDDPFADVPY